MLDIGKLSGGREVADYYLGLRREAEASAAAYYTESDGLSEPPGRWFGQGLAAAGIEPGRIDDEAFAELLEAHVAPDGAKLGRKPRSGDGVAAFDLTFRAPKSVSLLVAYGDSEVAEAARQAHAGACREAVRWLEVEACGVRLAHGEKVEGDDGQVQWKTRYQRADGVGFVGASFEQFTSRTLDPQLHTHHVTVNKTLGPDGTWRTLDGQRLYTSAKAAGTVYQAELRRQLTEQLGVEWGPVENGLADIAGFDRELIEHFSTRRQQIKAYMAEHLKADTAKAAQEATLQTRPAKGHPDAEAVKARWEQLEADAPQPVREVVARAVQPARRAAPVPLEDVDRERMFRQVARTLARRSPTFARPDVVEVVADVLPAAVDDRQGLVAAADQWLAWARQQGELVGLLSPDAEVGLPVELTAGEVDRLVDRGWMVQQIGADGRAGQIRRLRWLPGQQRYTTQTLLRLEQEVVAAARQPAGRPVVDADAVQHAAGQAPTLLDAQQAVLEELAGADRRVVAVVGPGGSGKTYTLGVAAEAWQAEGRPVVGTAMSGAAADELGRAAGIPAETIAQLQVDVDRYGHAEVFRPGVVVVADEASMIDTADLAWLVRQVEQADGQLVVVGDPAQLPSVGAGGVFHRLADSPQVIDDLVGVNARQQLAADRQALAELRGGQIAAAVDRYDRHGRLHIADTPLEVMGEMVADWAADVDTFGLEEARMLAARRQDVATLNELARHHLEATGRLSGPTVQTGGRRYRIGDRVVATHNDRRYAKLRNSHTGTVVHTDPQTGQIVMRRDHDGQLIGLPEAYARRHLDWAYATTAHKAQGATLDANVRVYVDLQGATRREHGYVALSRAVRESHLYVAADQMPAHIEAGVLADERQAPADRLVDQLQVSAVEPLAADSGRPVASERSPDLVARRDELADQLQAIPPDVSNELAEAEQLLEDARRRARQPDAPKGVVDRAERLEDRYRQLADQAEARARWIDEHGAVIAEYRDVSGELAARADRRLVSLPFDNHARQVLGPPPGRAADRSQVQAWRNAAREYVAVEQRHGTVDLSDQQATRKFRRLTGELERTRKQPQATKPAVIRRL